jgi:hypothetical protein
MKVYERRAGSPFKWIFAGLVFVLAMTFTMAEVNGFNCPPAGNKDDASKQGTVQKNHDGRDGRSDGDHQRVDPPPSAVPEPTTLMLMAAGLGLALWYSNRKTAQE